MKNEGKRWKGEEEKERTRKEVRRKEAKNSERLGENGRRNVRKEKQNKDK